MADNSSKLIQILTHSMGAVSKTDNSQEINQIIIDLLKNFTSSDTATLFLYNEEEQLLYTIDEKPMKVSMVNAEGLLGESFLTKSPKFYNHLASEKQYNKEIDNPFSTRIKSQIISPIIENDNLIGVVRVSRLMQNPEKYSAHEMELLTSLHDFLVKIVHIIQSDKLDTKIDTQKIAEQIVKTEIQHSQEVTDDSTMLFISNTVHDIRTPANSLYGFLELIEEEIDDERIKSFVQNAKESAKFINTLTSSILDHGKSAYNSKDLELADVNSVKFFSQIADGFSANMTGKSINYIIYIDPMLPKEISIDEMKLRRVISNLIGNAYKFTPTDKRIDFRVVYDREKQLLNISVRDRGIGISQEAQKSIFKPFEQAEDDTSQKYGGTGLGLSICADYVTDLGGELKLDSKLEVGSDFYFSIPIEPVDESPSFERFVDMDKQVVILTDYLDCLDAKNILDYIVELGLPRDKIEISSTVGEGITHIICFQHKISNELFVASKENKTAILLVEEKLFSLNKSSDAKAYKIISENTYYGNSVHEFTFSKSRKKILLVDDNKINIILLESMLGAEFVKLHSTNNGYTALEILEQAHNDVAPFDILFIDKHMPSVSGTEVMKIFRSYEEENNFNPIHAISITGEPIMSEEEHKLYDLILKKPFRKDDVVKSIQ